MTEKDKAILLDKIKTMRDEIAGLKKQRDANYNGMRDAQRESWRVMEAIRKLVN